MNLKTLAFGLVTACAVMAAPAYANTATAIFCDSDFGNDDAYSQFVNAGHQINWTGGGEGCDDEGDGVRINLHGSNGAFRLNSSSTGCAEPFRFVVYENRLHQTFSTNVYPVTHGGSRSWSFNGVAHGYAALAIYFADFGDESCFFTDTVAPPTVSGGGAVPVRRFAVEDCEID